MAAETKTETELVINSPSQKLILEALRTTPVHVGHCEFTFVAGEIVPFQERPYEERLRGDRCYIDECLASGVIPHSRLRMKYGSNRFVDWGGYSSDATFQMADSLPEGYLSTMEAVITGGRLHMISYLADTGNGREPFEQFRDQHLPLLVKRGYTFWDGDIWLTPGYFPTRDPQDSIHLLRTRQYGSESALVMKNRVRGYGDDTLSKEQVGFQLWFRELAATHNLEVTVPAEHRLR